MISFQVRAPGKSCEKEQKALENVTKAIVQSMRKNLPQSQKMREAFCAGKDNMIRMVGKCMKQV